MKSGLFLFASSLFLLTCFYACSNTNDTSPTTQTPSDTLKTSIKNTLPDPSDTTQPTHPSTAAVCPVINGVVQIKDKGFKEYLIKLLKITDTNVTLAHIDTLKGLGLSWTNSSNEVVDSTHALSCFAGLENLYVASFIRDYAFLSIFPKLTSLILDDCGTKNNALKIIGNISSLQRLESHINDAISNISPLAKLTRLRVLKIRSSDVSDFTALKSMTQLTCLHLADGFLKDLSVLSRLTELDTLDFTANHIQDLTPLSHLPKLKYLVA